MFLQIHDFHHLQDLIKEYHKHFVLCPILNKVLERNEVMDRSERDWLTKYGRSLSSMDTTLENIIVFSGMGIIGKQLCKSLLEKNGQIRVICVDNINQSSILNATTESLFNNPRFEYANINICDYFSLNIDKIKRIYYLLYCGINNKNNIMDMGYMGTKNVLETANKYRTPVFYCNALTHDITKTEQSNQIIKLYQDGCYMANNLCDYYKTFKGVKVFEAEILQTESIAEEI